jgi:hypothetical protein
MPPSLALVTTPPPALTKRHSSLSYIRGAVASPVCVALSIFAACVGLGYAGLIGSVLAMLAIVTAGIASTRFAFVRDYLDQQSENHVRSLREGARMRALRPSGPVRQTQYLELRSLVEELEKTAPEDAARYELQDLLDHFVRLAVGHQKCIDALRLAGAGDLSPIPITGGRRSKRRREIQTRRAKHRDECVSRIERITDELEATDELIRLIAQRAACPALDSDLDRELDRRLWEIDEVDAAMSQLSA